ncbi:hypothetical protein AGMMS49949_09070 [Alphaproteobacteria bacterium]|nr:hypothetical protein AGMMS49949_09070 [Alphaproteobacteria bacterium]GHS98534.1 hypothetical protein AGMMS50296_6250 [Alphaproteobacteria bacterium]
MDQEIISLLSKACEQAAKQPQNPHELSVHDEKVVENFFKSRA